MVHGEPFGDALRRFREATGLTQEQLAERAGLSYNAIGSLERGDRQRPYPHTIQALATALQLSADQRAYLQQLIPPRIQGRQSPAASSPLIGREADLRMVIESIEASETRLVTLTGPGGVGKTRLALAAAEHLASRFRDGVAVISLSALRDPNLVIPTIVRELDLRESGQSSPLDGLVRYLRRRTVLLVLDNMEHLPAAAADVAILLATAPRLRVLATSRSPLALQGERLVVVPPPTEAAAAELFVQSSNALSTAADATSAASVAQICARLDYLPLAIELAAAHMRVLSAGELLAHLQGGARGSASRDRDVPERHRSLHETIAWSHALLKPPEQQLFRALSVCAGSWTLEAAAAIARVEPAAAIELHRGLVDASLISRRASMEPAARFGMLETIRSFAAEQLQHHGEAQPARPRHAQYFTNFTVATGADLWDRIRRRRSIYSRSSTTTCGRRSSGCSRMGSSRRLHALPSRHGCSGGFAAITAKAAGGSIGLSRRLAPSTPPAVPSCSSSRQIEQVDDEVRELRMRWMRGVVLNTRARLALAGDDAGTVTRVMTEAIDILSGLQDSWAIRYPLAYLATAAAMRSKPRRAAVLYGVADAFSERSGNISTFPVPQQVADRYRAQIEAELRAALFEEVVEQGRALPFQEALALAREGSE